MKVLFLIDSLGSAGKERQLTELLKGLELRKSVTPLIVVLSDHVYYPYVKDLNVRTYHLKRKTKKDISIFYKLYKICKEFRPDIIHSWERMCSFYAVPASIILNSKLINGAIRNASPKSKPLGRAWIRDRLTFPFSNVILANSQAGLKSFNVPIHKGYYIHNGFNFSRIKNLTEPKSMRKKFKITTPFVVGMVGRFHPSKDYESFITCALQILRSREDVTFVAVGDGSNARGNTSKSTFELCKKMVPHEFKEKVIFTGLQTNVESIINVFSIGMLLTNLKVHREGVSNSIMEYAALGKPVIATLGGGTPEIIQDGINGFLIQNNNIEQLKEKIDILLNDKELGISMGKKGKEKVQKEFNIELMIQNFVNLYERILKKNF
jgi:glycosyltransferase involved in cell wall biosynthesis